jgi:hypothetical protein
VTKLLSSTTEMRAWYAARDHWRVDVVDLASERGLYQTPDGQYTWDYGSQHLTFVSTLKTDISYVAPNADDIVVFSIGSSQVRLPRAADLMPPDLARRLLNAAAGDKVSALPTKRIAGMVAAGLRVTPTDPHSTIGQIDIWADPASGLPLQVELTAKGAERPILVTRFLEVDQSAPNAAALVPPEPREEFSTTITGPADGDTIDALVDHVGLAMLPDTLAGLPRRALSGSTNTRVIEVDSVALYGTGLAQVAVVPLSRQIGGDAYRTAAAYGERITFSTGFGAQIATSLLSVMVVESTNNRRRYRYLVAGMVDSELLRQVGADLARLER